MNAKRKFPAWLKNHFDQPSFLASGGMGSVFKAYHRARARWEAVKVMAEAGVDPKRLGREIASARYYEGPRIVAIYEEGCEQGYYWYAMELVAGGSLGDTIKQNRSGIERNLALDYIAQACFGLAPAHRLGNVHRDIKPANLLLTEDGTVKVADWGITKVVRNPEGDIFDPSSRGLILGTIPYMSRELLSGNPCPACDVWALGITLVQLLTGSLVAGTKGNELDKCLDVIDFAGAIERAGLQAVLHDRGVVLQDAEMLRLLSGCLQPECKKRIPSAGDLGFELCRLLGWRDLARERDQLLHTLDVERGELGAARTRNEEIRRERDAALNALREQHTLALEQAAIEAQAAVSRAVEAVGAEHAGAVDTLKNEHAAALAEQSAAHARAMMRLVARGANPFEHTGVQEMFGRRREIDALTGRLLGGESFVLHGVAKVGKSCLLREVRGALLARRAAWVVVTVEIDRLWTRGARVFRALLDGLAKETGVAVPKGELSAEAFLESLSRYKDESLRARPDHRVVLIVDQYDLLVPEFGDAGIPDLGAVLSAWNRLFKEGWVILIACGRSAALTRAASFGTYENPFLDAMVDEKLEPMPRAEHHEMIAALASRQAKVRLGSGALDTMFEETGGHPALSRRLGTAVLERFDGEVDSARVAEAARAISVDAAAWGRSRST